MRGDRQREGRCTLSPLADARVSRGLSSEEPAGAARALLALTRPALPSPRSTMASGGSESKAFSEKCWEGQLSLYYLLWTQARWKNAVTGIHLGWGLLCFEDNRN